MNALHICRNYGSSPVYVDLFARLARFGMDQQVYVPEKHPALIGRNLPENGAFPVRYSLIARPWDVALYHTKARRAAPDAAEKFDLASIDLIHAHTLFTDGGIAYRLYRERGIPYVVSVRMTDLSYFFRYMPHLRGHGLRVLEGARRVVFLSPAGKDALLSRYVPGTNRDALTEKCAVIPNGLDIAWFRGASPRNWSPGEPLCLAFAGRLERNKQPLRALEAVRALGALLPDSPISLHVAGTGPQEKALRAHPAARDGTLTLCGHLDGLPALRDFYDRCHLFLLPSLAETFGLVYLEAMSRGLPVLYTRGQGFDGHFADGEAGYAVNPDDGADIARGAVRALEGYAERSARCIKAAATMTWERVARRMAALYADAMEGSP